MWPEAERHTSAVGRFARSWLGLTLIGAVISTLAGVLFALPQLGTSHWHDELRIYLAQFWIWAALTPLIALVDRQLPFSGRELGKRLSAHILASLVFTEIYFYLFTTIRALFGVTTWSLSNCRRYSAPRSWDGSFGAG